LLKKVPAPPGPTKLKGPFTLLLAAAWNCRFDPDGRAAFVQDSVVHVGVKPGAGLASFTEETKSPDAAKPLLM